MLHAMTDSHGHRLRPPIDEPQSIRKVLGAMGLSAKVPGLLPAIDGRRGSG